MLPSIDHGRQVVHKRVPYVVYRNSGDALVATDFTGASLLVIDFIKLPKPVTAGTVAPLRPLNRP